MNVKMKYAPGKRAIRWSHNYALPLVNVFTLGAGRTIRRRILSQILKLGGNTL
jgi:hypothetical protein